MKSNYRRIGDFIRKVNVRNTELNVTSLMGINIDKFFMPSVANTVGTDMSKYKIVQSGHFACNRMHVGRDKRLPIALWKGKSEIIVSPAYDVFEIVNPEILNPEYLMICFLRKDFDRNAWFYTDADVRGGLKWEDFCNINIPVPSINKQNEIVKAFNVWTDRLNLNNSVIQKIEETIQLIYKQWFISFDFPDTNGKPYHSSGGEMEYNERLDKEIPKGWQYGTLGSISTVLTGFPFQGEEYSFDEGLSVLRGENVTEQRLRWDTHKKWNKSFDENYLLKELDIVIGMDGSKVGKNWSIISKYELPLLLAQRVARVRAINPYSQIYLYNSLSVLSFENYVSQVRTGTSVPHISGQQIKDFPILIPPKECLEKFNSITVELVNYTMIFKQQNIILSQFGDILMTMLFSKKEMAL